MPWTKNQSGVPDLLNSSDPSLHQAINGRPEVGAKLSRHITQCDQLLEVSDHLTEMLGKTEGADLAKTISDLTQQEFVYQAFLAASAKIIQPTSLDFLR